MYNSKPLTKEELKDFKSRFTFEILTDSNNYPYIMWERKNSGKGCCVKLTNSTKIVLSNRNRKYTISSKAIALWLKKYKDSTDYTLFDVQQALLAKAILFMDDDFIDKYMSNPNISIKII
jgi:hypothetical protein